MIFLLVIYSVNFVLAVLDIAKEYIFIMDAILNKYLYVHVLSTIHVLQKSPILGNKP